MERAFILLDWLLVCRFHSNKASKRILFVLKCCSVILAMISVFGFRNPFHIPVNLLLGNKATVGAILCYQQQEYSWTIIIGTHITRIYHTLLKCNNSGGK